MCTASEVQGKGAAVSHASIRKAATHCVRAVAASTPHHGEAVSAVALPPPPGVGAHLVTTRRPLCALINVLAGRPIAPEACTTHLVTQAMHSSREVKLCISLSAGSRHQVQSTYMRTLREWKGAKHPTATPPNQQVLMFTHIEALLLLHYEGAHKDATLADMAFIAVSTMTWHRHTHGRSVAQGGLLQRGKEPAPSERYVMVPCWGYGG